MDAKAAFARVLLAASLAAIPPASADDASEFFALFDRTCAKSLTDQQAFIEAAKAAGFVDWELTDPPGLSARPTP